VACAAACQGLGNEGLGPGLNPSGRPRSIFAANISLYYASSTKKGIGVVLSPYPRAEIIGVKDVLVLSPHVTWSPLEQLSFDLSADGLWPYKDNLVQRNSPTCFLTVTASY